MKPTPGPWRVVKRANQTGLRMLCVATDKSAGGVWEPHVSCLTDQNLADAHLIAAAPRMRATLERCRDTLAGFLNSCSDAEIRDSFRREFDTLNEIRFTLAEADGVTVTTIKGAK